ncbi:Mitochondrial transcription factor 1 [Apophysomyces ossiformis]|uniref:rRNA adenine N(6)-methyltransferase n=1 Tax=Apophysomyces ossiformis TaxID=679940 RepID=A0A8H7BPL2_9FUNG|nr:Mitochondrial transcription factor 1 [Apophysomyces ossiformis]
MSAARRISVQVPKLAEWNKAFRLKGGSVKVPRCTLSNPTGAAQALAKLNIRNPQETTVVELYPGLGVWTAALFNANFKRIITLEPHAQYFQQVEQIAQQSNGVIEALKKDGYDWDTYVELKKPEYLGQLINTDWTEIHPNILFTGTLPKAAKGEQLLAQFATCIINKMAIHSMGRIQMALWIPDALYKKYQKFVAPPGSSARCKMGAVTEACAQVKVIATTNETCVYPNNEYHLVHITPFASKIIKSQWDVFEYVLKHLFVMQKQPLSKMIKTLGPGADIILGRLSFDPSIAIGQMTVKQIDEVAIKFDQWPLRPRVLFEDASIL